MKSIELKQSGNECAAGQPQPAASSAVAAPARSLRLLVNGAACRVHAAPNELLLDCLRRRLGLTGAKRGCDDSSCGACTVLVAGRPVLSCTLLAASCAGEDGEALPITTIEGLHLEERLRRLQLKFGEIGGAQCGFCTPGMIVSAAALLQAQPHPDAAAIRQALSGNLCRCTGYVQIVQAVCAALAETETEAIATPEERP